MNRLLPALLLAALSACAAPLRNDPASADYYGLDLALVRTYRTHFPLCGKPHDHYMQKRGFKELSLAGGKAVVIEILLEKTFSAEIHALPLYSREVFAETERGFGYYELKADAEPDAAEAAKIDIEVPKPVRPGTRLKYEGGEVIVETVEDVVVKAGRFAGCVRVRYQFEKDANVLWFAPGVGMVKGYSESKGKDGRPALEYELVELTRASAR